MHEFYRVEDAAFIAGGGIAVANRGSAEVRLYDSAGRFIAALGTEGDGPGEFRRLTNVERYAGDSLVAFDPPARRATIMTASGALGRVVTFNLPENTMTTPVVSALYAPGSGGFLVSVTVMPSGRPSPGRVRIAQLILAMSPAGQVQDTVAGMDGFEQYVGASGISEPPLARLSHAAPHRDELHVCDGERPEYTVFARDGTVRGIVRVPTLSLDVPERVLDSIRASLQASRAGIEEMSDLVPTTYPACSSILVDPTGNVWLERYHPLFRMSADPRSWLVFAPDGTWLGQLDLPANFEAFEVDESRILGVAKDSLEVETVQVLRLTRR